MDPSIRRLAREIDSLKRQIRGISAPKLAHSSIENGAIEVYDADNNLTAIIGQQYDGTTTVVPLAGPRPPMPSQPVLEAGIRSLNIRWDGVFAGEDRLPDPMIVAPMDFSRVEVHVSQDMNMLADTPDTLVGTIESPRGGSVVVQPLPAEEYWVKLVTRSQTGKASDATDAVSETPLSERKIVLDEIDASETVLKNAALMAVDADRTLGQAINDAAASPVTNERLQAGSLSVWPFQQGTIPSGAIAPGTVGREEIADLSITVSKLRSTRHYIY